MPPSRQHVLRPSSPLPHPPHAQWSSALDEQYTSALAYAERMRPRRPVAGPLAPSQPTLHAPHGEPVSHSTLGSTAVTDATDATDAAPSPRGRQSVITSNWHQHRRSMRPASLLMGRRSSASSAQAPTPRPHSITNPSCTLGWEAGRWRRRSLAVEREAALHPSAVDANDPAFGAMMSARSGSAGASASSACSLSPTASAASVGTATPTVADALRPPAPLQLARSTASSLASSAVSSEPTSPTGGLSPRARIKAMLAPTTTLSALWSRLSSPDPDRRSDRRRLDASPHANRDAAIHEPPSPCLPERRLERCSIGALRRGVSVGGTAKQLVSPRHTAGERNELAARMDPERITQTVLPVGLGTLDGARWRPSRAC